MLSRALIHTPATPKTSTPPSHIRVNLPVLIDGALALGLGAWRFVDVPLYDSDNRARWCVHPKFRERVDVVALPFDVPSDVAVVPYRAHDPVMPIPFQPATEVYVIGFPFGRSSYEGLGIWTRGTVASEPTFPFEGLQRFLIDARTRPSQSGSPVHMPVNSGPPASRSIAGANSPWLVGVYSGRVNEQSDLGFVWPTPLLVEIISAAERDEHGWTSYEDDCA